MLIRDLLVPATALALFMGPAMAGVLPQPAEVEAFADETVEAAMAAAGVPGAFVAVVARDRNLLVKGYGVADMTSGVPVDPERTRFNLGSIGKAMTALAAVTLAQRGEVDLDRDVNAYFEDAGRDLAVSNGPVTLRQLLIHHGGFDNNLSHLFVGRDGDVAMSDAEINRRLVLLRRPGRIFGYDNQGYGLIGLVLSAASRRPFPEILQREVFMPLGMTHTEYVLPGPPDPDLAACHVPVGPDRVGRCEYPVFREALQGAGGVAASAGDMARFMRLLLNEGRLGDEQLISEDVLRQLLDFDRYRFHTALPGFSWPYTQLNDSDRPAYAHGGHVPGFSSLMTIYPDAGLGVIISYLGGGPPSYDFTPANVLDTLLNHQPATAAAAQAIYSLETFPNEFAERFIAARDAYPLEPVAGAGNARALAGSYFPTADVSRSLASRLQSLTRRFRIEALDDDRLTLNGQGPYHAISAQLYAADSGHRLAFREDEHGVLMAAGLSVAAFERRSGAAAASWSLPAFGLGLLGILSALPWLWPRAPRAMRRGAAWCGGGLVLLLAGLLAEMQWGVWVRIVEGGRLLPMLWLGLAALGAIALLSGSAGLLRGALRTGAGAGRVAALVHAGLCMLSAALLVIAPLLWLT